MASEASKTRVQATAVSVVILVINFVCLAAVSYYLSSSLRLSVAVLENRSQQTKAPANLTTTDERKVDGTLMQLTNSIIDFLHCISSSIPQFIGAWMLLTATEKKTSPKRASEMVARHQKIQWFFLGLDLVRAFLMLADLLAENNIDSDCALVFLGTRFFRVAGIFIVDRFATELLATTTLANDAGAMNLKV